MPIVVDSEGKYVSGDFSFESRDASDASIWPVAKSDEIKAAYFEDLRKHMYLLLNPAAGSATSVHDGDDFDFQTEIDNYAQNVIGDSDFPDKIGQSFGAEINWDGFRWICAGPSSSTFDQYNTADFPDEDFEYGINNSHLYSSTAAWDAHKPPEQPEPGTPTIFYNTYWRMKADTNESYHEFDKYSPTYEAAQNRIGGTSDSYLYLASAKEVLPEQIDPSLTHDGSGQNFDHEQEGGKNCISGEEKTTYYNDAKEFLRRFITQIESLGTAHTPSWDHKSSNGIGANYYTFTGPQFAGSFPNGDPLNPEKDSSNPDQQIQFEPKVCAAYQNALTRIIENLSGTIHLPVDNTYMKNKVEYAQWQQLTTLPEYDDFGAYKGLYANNLQSKVKRFDAGEWHIYRCIADVLFFENYFPDGGGWDDTKWALDDEVWSTEHIEDNPFAAINSPFWGCNESGLEKMLSYIGSYDWFFDTENPYVYQTALQRQHFEMEPLAFNVNQHLEQQSPNVYRNNFTNQEYDTGFGKQIGCWRRTWKFSFGRIDQRETADYETDENPSDGTDTNALTKTLMYPGSYPQQDSKTLWTPLDQTSTYHWFGDNDDDPVRGPGEHPAVFQDATHPMPWPGTWDGDTKSELWVGHTWSSLSPGIRPDHLPYFDDNGETFEQYDPPVEQDGRPDFEYETLKAIYDTDPGSLSPEETDLVEAFIAMNKRHNPSQIANDVAEYEIFAEMLNEMRLVLLNSRTRFYTLGFDQNAWDDALIGPSFGSPEDTITNIDPDLIAWGKGEMEDFDPGEFDTPDTWGPHCDDIGRIDNAEVDPTASGQGNVVGWKNQMGKDFAGHYHYTSTGSFTDYLYRAYAAVQLTNAKLNGIYNCEQIFLYAKTRFIQSFIFRDEENIDNSVPFKLDFTGDIDTIEMAPVLNRVFFRGYQPWQYYSLALNPPEGTEESPWIEARSERDEPTSPPDPWFLGDSFDARYQSSLSEIYFNGEVLFIYDWDLVPASVFDTPNINGISECPSE